MWWIAFRRMCVLPALFLLAAFCGATLLRLAPGFDVDEREVDARFNAQSIARIRESRAKDRNILAYYGRFLSGVFTGDLGVSRTFGRPVTELLRERLPVTARLVGYGVLSAWIAGFGCALGAALWPRGRLFELAGVVASCVLLSLPAALVAIVFLYWRSPLPLALGLMLFPRIFTYAHNLLEHAGQAPHVTHARARGVGRVAVLFRHVAPAALPQLGALAAISVSLALGAVIPLEALCDQPGVGQLAWQAALGRDLPLLIGLTLMIALVVMTANAISDLSTSSVRSQA